MASPEDPQPASLDVGRSSRFLNRLEQDPFIALVVDPDEGVVHVYRKGITLESIQAIREYLDEMEQEMHT